MPSAEQVRNTFPFGWINKPNAALYRDLLGLQVIMRLVVAAGVILTMLGLLVVAVALGDRVGDIPQKEEKDYGGEAVTFDLNRVEQALRELHDHIEHRSVKHMNANQEKLVAVMRRAHRFYKAYLEFAKGTWLEIADVGIWLMILSSASGVLWAGHLIARVTLLDQLAMRLAARIGASLITKRYYTRKMVPARERALDRMKTLLCIPTWVDVKEYERRVFADGIDALFTRCGLLPPPLTPSDDPLPLLEDVLEVWCPETTDTRGEKALLSMLQLCRFSDIAPQKLDIPGGTPRHAVLCALVMSLRPWWQRWRQPKDSTMNMLTAVPAMQEALEMYWEDPVLFKRTLEFRLARADLPWILYRYIRDPVVDRVNSTVKSSSSSS
jgi:hypothetical protein